MTVVNGGWFGLASHVRSVLEVVGADRDEAGNFMVSGGMYVGLGEEEVAIDETAAVLVKGKWVPLASMMNDTSYGCRRLTVIAGGADDA